MKTHLIRYKFSSSDELNSERFFLFQLGRVPVRVWIRVNVQWRVQCPWPDQCKYYARNVRRSLMKWKQPTAANIKLNWLRCDFKWFFMLLLIDHVDIHVVMFMSTWMNKRRQKRENKRNEWMNEWTSSTRSNPEFDLSLMLFICVLSLNLLQFHLSVFLLLSFSLSLCLTLSFWFATWFRMRCTLQSVHTHSETHASNIVVILPRVACAVTTTSNDNEPRERGREKKEQKNEWIRSSSSLWTCTIVCPKYLLNELLILDWRRRRQRCRSVSYWVFLSSQ